MPVPGALERELSIEYAGYKVGGDQTNRILHDVYMVSQNYEQATVEFRFTAVHTTEAAFADEIAAAEAAFRKPRQDCVIKQGAKTLESYTHDTTSTGFNSAPQIVKREDDTSTGRSRTYTVRITFELPADNVGTSFRRDSSVNVAYSPSRRRTATISGTYTANAATAARAQYESAFAAFATSVLNGLGGTYKLLQEPQSTHDSTNKILHFAVTYEEILYTGIGSSDSSLRSERLTVTVSRSAPGDTPDGGAGIERLTELTGTYEAWFDTTTAPQSARTKWDGTLRTKVIEQLSTYLSGGSLAIMSEVVNFNPVDNKLDARVVGIGSTAGGVVQHELTVTDQRTSGKQLVPVFDGDPFSKYAYQGPANWRRTITQHFETFDKMADLVELPGPFFPQGNPLSPPAGFALVFVVERPSKTPKRRGIPPDTIDTIVHSNVLEMEFYRPVAPGGGITGETGEAGVGVELAPAHGSGPISGGGIGGGGTPGHGGAGAPAAGGGG